MTSCVKSNHGHQIQCFASRTHRHPEPPTPQIPFDCGQRGVREVAVVDCAKSVTRPERSGTAPARCASCRRTPAGVLAGLNLSVGCLIRSRRNLECAQPDAAFLSSTPWLLSSFSKMKRSAQGSTPRSPPGGRWFRARLRNGITAVFPLWDRCSDYSPVRSSARNDEPRGISEEV